MQLNLRRVDLSDRHRAYARGPCCALSSRSSAERFVRRDVACPAEFRRMNLRDGRA